MSNGLRWTEEQLAQVRRSVAAISGGERVKARSDSQPRRDASKYRSQSCNVDGIRFASKAEARRYQELKLLQETGAIRDLRLQVRHPLVVAGRLICTYVSDFEYVHSETGTVIEDVKGMSLPMFRIKKKLFEALNEPLTITVIRKKT